MTGGGDSASPTSDGSPQTSVLLDFYICICSLSSYMTAAGYAQSHVSILNFSKYNKTIFVV